MNSRRGQVDGRTTLHGLPGGRLDHFPAELIVGTPEGRDREPMPECVRIGLRRRRRRDDVSFGAGSCARSRRDVDGFHRSADRDRVGGHSAGLSARERCRHSQRRESQRHGSILIGHGGPPCGRHDWNDGRLALRTSRRGAVATICDPGRDYRERRDGGSTGLWV